MTDRSAHEDPERIRRVAEALACAAGLAGPLRLVPLPGGANNRVFRLEGARERALLKAYFRHPDDPRDRLGAEFGFSCFAWARGVRAIPRPLAEDRERGAGLYEFVEGRKPEPGEVTEDWLAQAVAFFLAVNRDRGAAEARALPWASEACLSLGEHLALVEARVRRLASLPGEAGIDGEAVQFARGELLPVWERLAEGFRLSAEGEGFDLRAALEPAARRLSPSDFGYHNAILEQSGRLRFIDFEYAGWDDPAKTVCDFFCQPAVPAPIRGLDAFAAAVLADCPGAERHRRRIALLLPLYRMKWCCIMLNDFQPAGRARRRFADGGSVARAEAQLAKARRALASLAAETE